MSSVTTGKRARQGMDRKRRRTNLVRNANRSQSAIQRGLAKIASGEASLPPFMAAFERPKLYNGLYGGRASAKSRSIALRLLLDGLEFPHRIAIVREYESSTQETAKQAIVYWLKRLGWLDTVYDVQQNVILGPMTAAGQTRIFPVGLNEITAGRARGLEDVTRFWLEEAHDLKWRPLQVLLDTVRELGVQVWISFNPQLPTDAIWRQFITAQHEDSIFVNVNYWDNPFLYEDGAFAIYPPDRRRDPHFEGIKWDHPSVKRMMHVYENFPEEYATEWCGELKQGDVMETVLPVGMVERCFEAWRKYGAAVIRKMEEEAWPRHFGLDLSLAKRDKNALVGRAGGLIDYAEGWYAEAYGGSLDGSLGHARDVAMEMNARRLAFDVGGLGMDARSRFNMMGGEPGSIMLGLDPIRFEGKAGGAERPFQYGVQNGEYFLNRGAQMAWALRLRALATGRLMDGADVPLVRCLFLKDDGGSGMRDLAAQLSQPQYKETAGGKKQVVKSPGGAPSPDFYDAAAMAMAADSADGLSISW